MPFRLSICLLTLSGILLSLSAQAASTGPLLIAASTDTSKDWQDDLQNALDKAAGSGRNVKIAAGTYRHSGILKIQGIEVSGEGAATVLEGTTRDKAAIALTGSGSRINNVKLVFDAKNRSTVDESSMVTAKNAVNFGISHVIIDGSEGAGIFVQGSSKGTIENNEISNTLADSIHMTGGSSELTVTGNTIRNSGDDGIAVVSYEKNTTLTSRITIYGNSVLNNKWARGISVVGGDTVDIHDNTVACDKPFAGIYIASEPSYHTYGASNVKVHGNTVKGCGGRKYGHGAVMVYTGYKPNDHIDVTGNTIEDSPDTGVFLHGKDNRNVMVHDNRIIRSGGQALKQDFMGPSANISGNHIE